MSTCRRASPEIDTIHRGTDLLKYLGEIAFGSESKRVARERLFRAVVCGLNRVVGMGVFQFMWGKENADVETPTAHDGSAKMPGRFSLHPRVVS